MAVSIRQREKNKHEDKRKKKTDQPHSFPTVRGTNRWVERENEEWVPRETKMRRERGKGYKY